MERIRKVISYKNYFQDFLVGQPKKVQDKIFKIIEVIETFERIPSHYLKALKGTKGFYEARIMLGSDIWRVFCFFDKGRLVILLNGFTKKSEKTPKKEIDKALKLMESYYREKNNK
ncbi:type II toxin-antitoxin system RelE/ParE family toxin [Salinimicrobium sediminilitoris]|uniref:type II toxin-antitoxin system RelE/ParE family toxin n=1 Tax=Salinimicrobium sediminilitoris TaxID=2876715 RepID=UPI001E385BC6|nr:type II toxin-antitoxin system RelE/ParE family toxin [Salinimicrobium sediminilitoris]MCC8358815.1 type II toxin-antitoxin system RelE/ParE family toxin [Salinimicrobium sediminilitoris]